MYEIVLPFSVNVANVIKFIILELAMLPLVSWAVDRVNSKTNWNGILGGRLRVRKARWLFPVSRLNLRLGFLLPLVILGLSLAAEFGFGSRSSENMVVLRGLQKLGAPNDTLSRASEKESIISACLPERAASGFETSRPLVVNPSNGICVEISDPSEAAVQFRNVWQGQTEVTDSDKLDRISFGQLPQTGPAVVRGIPKRTSGDPNDVVNGQEYLFSGFRSEDPRFERGGLCRAEVSLEKASLPPPEVIADFTPDVTVNDIPGVKYKVSECIIWGSGGVRMSEYQLAGSYKCAPEDLIDPFKCTALATSERQAGGADDDQQRKESCCRQDLFSDWSSEVALSSTGETQLWVDVKVTNPEATFGVLAGRKSPFFIDETEWQGRVAALVVAVNELEAADLDVSVDADDERATINVLGLAATGTILLTVLLLMITRLVLGCFIEGSLDLAVEDVLDRWFDEAAQLYSCASPAKSDRTLKLIRIEPDTMHISITGAPIPYDGVSKIL